jgi:VanZ family protein
MLRRPRTWLTLLAVWWVTLFILSHQSDLHPPGPDIENIDKVEHTAYFTLGGLCFFCWLRAWRPGISFLAATGLTILFCAVTGALDEFHQGFIPNRTGNDPGDWAADTLGGLLGSMAGAWLHTLLTRKKAPCESGEIL